MTEKQTPDLTRAILEQQLREIQEELRSTKALLDRPISVIVNGADHGALAQIVQYLPQLTQIATNLSHVASASQATNSTLSRIAQLLEEQASKPSKPNPPSSGTRACRCDGPTHAYTPGWCPPGGPVT